MEAALGTCACGRSIAPFVKSVTCLDATPTMLVVGEKTGFVPHKHDNKLHFWRRWMLFVFWKNVKNRKKIND